MIQIRTLNLISINNALQELWRKICCVEVLASSCCYETITLGTAQTLISDGKVVPNKLYKITGVHKNKVYTDELPIYVPVLFDDGTNSGVSIYLTGLSPTEFSTEGWGEFWNPKYRQDQYNGAVTEEEKTIFLQALVAGTGYANGTNVPTTGGTGTGMTVDIVTDAGGVIEVKINTLGSGYVETDTITIDSGNGDATFDYFVGSINGLYDIWDGDNPIYSARPSGHLVGSTKIWGNYVWENVKGGVGSSVSYTELNAADWTKREYNSTDYNKVIDYIEYDFSNDWILRRKQSEPVIDILFPFQFWNSTHNGNPIGVTLHAIAVAQWGNKYVGVTDLGTGLVQVNDGYFEFANFKGAYILGFQVDKYSVVKNNYRGHNTIFDGIKIDNYSYQANCKFMNGAKQIYITMNNKCGQDDIVMGAKQGATVDIQEYFDFTTVAYQQSVYLEYGSIQRYFTFENYSGQTAMLLSSDIIEGDPVPCIQEYITLTNRAEVSTITLLNGALQGNIHFENGGGQLELTIDGGSQTYLMFDTSIFGYGSNVIASYPLVESYTRFSYNQLKYTFSKTFDGSAGGGAQGAISIQDMYIPTGFFISEVKIFSTGLAFGVGAYLSLGIETDDVDSGLDITSGDLATLDATPIFILNSLPFTQATALRKLVMEVNTADVTAGTISLVVTLSKL